MAVHPADVYIRDSSTDVGDPPSPGDHWEAPDLIVRRQPDGDTTFINEDLLRDGVTDHYIYGRVVNRGPNTARHVRLAVTVGNYPSLLALPGTEFRYPQDWYPGDWTTPAIQARHLFLGESTPIDVPNGATRLIGPIVWSAAQIPPNSSWHPCLLAEVRADNDDSAGGPNGCDVSADPDPCAYGSYFWGNNNVCQRNLTYAPVPPQTAAAIEFPFLLGSIWSTARTLEVIIDKGVGLADTPMRLRIDPAPDPGCPGPPRLCPPGELVLVDGGRVVVRVEDCDIGEIIAPAGTVWRPHRPCDHPPEQPTCHGGHRVGAEWLLTERRAAVGLPVGPGELHQATLSFTAPPTLDPGTSALVRIYQRTDNRTITGGVQLEVQIGRSASQ